MAILNGVLWAGLVVGSLLSAPVLKTLGTVYLLPIGAALKVLANALVNINLEESLVGAVQVS